MITDFILYWILISSLLAMAWALRQMIRDAKAQAEFEARINREGIKWPLQGFSDVSYREVPGRSTNR